MVSKSIIRAKIYNIAKHTPVILPSLSRASTFFIFRAQGVEVEFTTVNNKIFCRDYVLNSTEIAFINKTILNN